MDSGLEDAYKWLLGKAGKNLYSLFIAEKLKLGVEEQQAWKFASTRKSYWHVVGSFTLDKTLTNELFKRAKYVSFLDYYSL